MERLTIDEIIEHCDRKTRLYEKACDGRHLETTVMNNPIKEYWEHKQVAEYLRKLKEYEDLEEQGRLLKLPCKVGDTIYIIAPKCCDCTGECDLYNKRFGRNLKWCKKYCPNGFKDIGVLETVIQRLEIRENDTYVMTDKDGLRDLGNISLTKSEAEAKLKELRKKDECFGKMR